MKKCLYLIILLSLVSCTSRKSNNDANGNEADSVAVIETIRHDLPPPPPNSGRVDGHRPPPPPDGMHPGGPPPPHGKGHHKPDNMRGFDPASEDDMDDNGMSRYMENNAEEGWD